MSWLEDADIAPCGRCGTDVVLDHDGVCPHGYVACEGCGWEAVCADCQRQATDDMFASGTYTEAGDPLVDRPAMRTEAAYEARTALPGFCPTCNGYACTHRRDTA